MVDQGDAWPAAWLEERGLSEWAERLRTAARTASHGGSHDDPQLTLPIGF